MQFEKVIYLDRYLDENFTELKDKRNEVAQWRSELDKHKKAVDKYSKPSVSSPALRIHLTVWLIVMLH